jgi:plastocyanin
MRLISFTPVAVLVLVSLVSAGDIDGKIVKSSGRLFSADHPSVVWLEGAQPQTPVKTEVGMAQRSGQFVPSFLVVVAGQTVSLPNEDPIAHNVYSDSAAKHFNLGYYAKGDIKAVTFDRPGMVDLHCVLHAFMRATILVVPNRYYATVAADGSFRIRNVPPGTFSLNFWADGMPPFSQAVTVPQDGKLVTVHFLWTNFRSR